MHGFNTNVKENHQVGKKPKELHIMWGTATVGYLYEQDGGVCTLRMYSPLGH